MSAAINEILSNMDYCILLLFRVGALVITSPVFGRALVPARAKICLIAAITYLFFTISTPSVIQYSSLLGLLLLIASEVLIGISLAFVTNIFFALSFIAGQLIDMQIGFGIVNVYDIQNNTQVPMMGNVLNLLFLIIFFLMNGQLRLVEVVYLTLDKIPVGGLHFTPEIGLVALQIFSKTFLMGIMIALPVIASGLILEIAFGALIRTVPQMNMFVIGVPMKTLVGLFVLLTTIPMYVSYCENIFNEMFIGIDNMFSTFVNIA